MQTTRTGYKYIFWFLGLTAVLYFLAKYIMPLVWHLVG